MWMTRILSHAFSPCWCLRAILPPGHANLSSAAWWHLSLGYDHVWVHGPMAARDSVDIHGSWYHQRTFKYPGGDVRVMLLLWPYRTEWPALSQGTMVMSGFRLQLRNMAGSMVLLQPGFMLISVTPDIIDDFVNARSLGCYLGPRWHPNLGYWWGSCLGHAPTIAGICLDVCGSWCHQRPWMPGL